MPPRVLQAYYDWKNSPPGRDRDAMQRLIGAAMDNVDALASVVTYDRVVTAVSQGGQPALAPMVGAAWRLFLMKAPRGHAAEVEATDWIMRLVPAAQQHRVFATVLDNLIAQVGTQSARR